MQNLNQNDMNLDIFEVDALDHFSSFIDSEERYRCTIIHL